jgi:hypothetical protein
VQDRRQVEEEEAQVAACLAAARSALQQEHNQQQQQLRGQPQAAAGFGGAVPGTRGRLFATMMCLFCTCHFVGYCWNRSIRCHSISFGSLVLLINQHYCKRTNS